MATPSNKIKNTQKKQSSKNLGGRPPIFKSAEEMQDVIDEYFAYCDNHTKEMHSEKLGDMIVADPLPYTMSGLARRLGIERTTLVGYSHKQRFFNTVRAARERVHEDVETRLLATRNEKGALFSLKNNFGWKDKTEIEEKGRLQVEVLHRQKPTH